MEDPVNQSLDKAFDTATNPVLIGEIPPELLLAYPKPREDDNAVNRAIYNHLIKQYLAERDDWPPELREEFKSEDKPLEYRITRSTGVANKHCLRKWMLRKMTWPRFWTLRVMFGPIACANQGWFEEFSRQYPTAMNDAPAGIVPSNFPELFNLQQWTPEEPQIERWSFHSTFTTSKGKRKAVSVMSEDTKKPKLTASVDKRKSNFTTSSFILAANTDTTITISTTGPIEVKMTMVSQDDGTNIAPRGSDGNESRPLTRSQGDNPELSDNITLMEEAIKQCSALHQVQTESLEFTRSQMQLVKEEHRAKERRLEELLGQERRERGILESEISKIKKTIKGENCWDSGFAREKGLMEGNGEC
ncbi:hypothetical protein V8C35DRAFT_326516 [Trichoderma chlorosporum]